MGHARTRPRPAHLRRHRPRAFTSRHKSNRADMTVLIITRSDDNESVSMVTEAIKRKGGEAIRFDTDRYPTEVCLSAYYGKDDDERLTLTNDEGKFNLREVTAIWHRRLNFGAQLPTTLDRQLRNASLGETRAAAQGMI